MAERWIQKAIKNPGALTKAAKKAGAMTKKGTIEVEWLEGQAKKGGTVGKRARLAQTLRKLGRKKKGAKSTTHN